MSDKEKEGIDPIVEDFQRVFASELEQGIIREDEDMEEFGKGLFYCADNKIFINLKLLTVGYLVEAEIVGVSEFAVSSDDASLFQKANKFLKPYRLRKVRQSVEREFPDGEWEDDCYLLKEGDWYFDFNEFSLVTNEGLKHPVQELKPEGLERLQKLLSFLAEAKKIIE